MAYYSKNLFNLLVISIMLAFVNLASGAGRANVALETAANESINFLVFSDIHLNVNQTNPMEINPSQPSQNNTLDKATFVSMLDKIKSTFPQPPFILITGDMAGYDSTCVYQDEEFVLQNINSAFPDTPKILVFGNTDSLETPFGPFYYSTGISGVHSTYELAMQNGWKDGFLSTGNTSPGTYPCIINEDPINGNFSLYLADNLRLIAFNSIIFSSDPSNQASQAETDAELSWITNELQSAVALNNKILITTHIPCGNDISIFYQDLPFWRSNNQTAFSNLLSRYQKNIIGILCGHTHQEELKTLQNTAHHNVGVILVTPAFITMYGNAPGVKSYYLNRNGSNWVISDYVTYNFTGNSASFSLQQLYDFHDYYRTGTGLNIIDYLSKVTVSKMSNYYTVGNPNYKGQIAYPYDILITLPDVK